MTRRLEFSAFIICIMPHAHTIHVSLLNYAYLLPVILLECERIEV